MALTLAPAGDGALHQTNVIPRTNDAAFRNLTTDLWLAVTTGNPSYGLPAFFPESAYEQVKAIADPAYDWRTRLWYDYTIDVAAAHQLVGGDAHLVTVVVPVQYATWIPVGACYNSTGYWHVPGARVEYRKGGQLESIGIASMISWRGVWYVVHFGGVQRTGGGMIFEPAVGEGVPGPPGGCSPAPAQSALTKTRASPKRSRRTDRAVRWWRGPRTRPCGCPPARRPAPGRRSPASS